MALTIEKLFNKNRLDGSVMQLLLLTLYTPIGLVLLMVRLFISLQLIVAVTVLPRGATITRLILRCLCGVLGLIVRQEDLHNNPLYEDDEQQLEGNSTTSLHSSKGGPQDAGHRKRLVVVSNHITPFDHFALSAVMPCVKLSCNGEGIPWPLSYLLGNQVVSLQPVTSSPSPSSRLLNTATLAPTPPRRDEMFLTKLKGFIGFGRSASPAASNSTGGSGSAGNNTRANSLPLLVFAEDGTTNGTVALMRYQPWAAHVCGVTPSVVCVRVRRLPCLPLATSVLTSSFTQELLTLLFCPLTVYTVRYLGRVARLPDESDAEFGKRLQGKSAEALGLQTTTYDVLEKAEYVKRCLTAQQQQQHWVTEQQRSPTELQTLARQVHEVLPHLPLTAIVRDIARTGNVDMTITNFLEGAVPDYTVVTRSSMFDTRSAASVTPLSSNTSTSMLLNSSSCSSTASPGSQSSANNSPISLCTKASTFSRSASDRMMSFTERKAVLLENAVRKYIEKFGLHGENDPYMKAS